MLWILSPRFYQGLYGTGCHADAWRLEFKHPTTQQPVAFEAPLPAEMQKLLDLLRKYRRI